MAENATKEASDFEKAELFMVYCSGLQTEGRDVTPGLINPIFHWRRPGVHFLSGRIEAIKFTL